MKKIFLTSCVILVVILFVTLNYIFFFSDKQEYTKDCHIYVFDGTWYDKNFRLTSHKNNAIYARLREKEKINSIPIIVEISDMKEECMTGCYYSRNGSIETIDENEQRILYFRGNKPPIVPGWFLLFGILGIFLYSFSFVGLIMIFGGLMDLLCRR